MADKLIFDPNDQTALVDVAERLSSTIEASLPRVPWLSNSGQQEAFRKSVDLIAGAVGKLDADEDAKEAVIFWILTFLYANSRRFALATASIKNWGGVSLSPIVRAFVEWVGSNVPPGHAIVATIMQRKVKDVMTSGLPERIHQKIRDIAFIKDLSPEEASAHFQELFTAASKKYMASGLSEREADQKAVEEVLALEISVT